MNRGTVLGLGIGAGLVYLLDPDLGRRRRARIRDSVAHAAALGRKGAGTTARDVRHRLYGTAAELGNAMRANEVDDTLLVSRVRAALGRVVSHPHAVSVSSSSGVVTLGGPILKAEVHGFLAAVKRVRGVGDVINELDEQEQAGDEPALQGGAGRRTWRADVLQRQWAPATRLAAGTTGAALAGYGSRQRTIAGMLFAAGGMALIARAATNLEARRLSGIGAGRRAVDVQKTMTIDAPIEEVFEFFADYGNFPRFMSRVLDVRPTRLEGQSHWTVSGPAGMSVQFDVELVRLDTNERIAWRTTPGSIVGHAGLLLFEPTPDRRTRVTIRMSYNPPGGWLGHGIASAFGVDPKSSLDADLARVKTLLETGRAPHDAARGDVLEGV